MKTLILYWYVPDDGWHDIYDFGNDPIFFAHNKGVSSTYVPPIILRYWIGFMYYACLENPLLVDNFESNPFLCSMGTFCITKTKPWSFLRYAWHYSGTFYWFRPDRITNIIKSGVEIPTNSRYFTEGFLGSIIPDDNKYRMALYGTMNDKGFNTCVRCREFVVNVLSKDELNMFENNFIVG